MNPPSASHSLCPPTPWRTRATFAIGCGIYVFACQLFYIHVVAPVYAQFGFPYVPPGFWSWLICSGMALIPTVWMPLVFVRPTQLLYLVIYLLVYIPAAFVPLFAGQMEGMDTESQITLNASMLVSLFIVNLIYFARLPTIKPVRVDSGLFWTVFLSIFAVSTIVLLATFGGSLSFVSLDAPHGHRLQSREVLSASGIPLVGYVLAAYSKVLNPILITTGWWLRKPVFAVIGFCGTLLVYACTAQRAELFWVMLIAPSLIMLFRVKLNMFIATVFSLASIMFVLIVANMQPELQTYSSAPRTTVLRLILIPGKLTGDYYQFFQSHATTSFSHVSGFGWVATNPYGDMPIGFVIGGYVYGNDQNMANANFLADGIAALGLLGMVIVSIITAGWFYVIDAVFQSVEFRPATLALSAFALPLTNGSIFSVFFGGGMALSVITITMVPWRHE
jgi:hypothetical protein